MSDTESTIALLLGLAGALTNVIWPLLRQRAAMLVAQIWVSVFFGEQRWAGTGTRSMRNSRR